MLPSNLPIDSWRPLAIEKSEGCVRVCQSSSTRRKRRDKGKGKGKGSDVGVGRTLHVCPEAEVLGPRDESAQTVDPLSCGGDDHFHLVQAETHCCFAVLVQRVQLQGTHEQGRVATARPHLF